MSKFRREVRATVRPLPAAQLIDQGVSKHVLDGPRWRRVARGFYVPTSKTALTPTQRIIDAVAISPPRAVVGGWAAAYAHGVDQLDGLDDHSLRPLPVPVFVPHGLHREAVPAVHYRQQALGTDEVVTLHGIPVTGRRRTALDVARWAPKVTEAVVALDAMLTSGVITLPALHEGLTDIGGRRGCRRAAQAVNLSRSGVRSNWESRLRMLWVLELGFEAPLVNRPVFDRYENFLGAPDLLDVEAGLVIEYDGGTWTNSRTPGGHRDPDQHREDNVREELFERAGLIVVRADKGDLTRYRARLRDRLRSARADGLRRDRSRDGWTLDQPERWYGMPA